MAFSFGNGYGSGGGGNQGQGQGQGLDTDLGGEPYTDNSLIDAMHMVLILPDKWASGYIFNSKAEAQTGLSDQRGSLPAGQTYKYEIWDREKVVETGNVTSTQYIPDDVNYFYMIHDAEANVNVVEASASPAFTTQAAAKAAAIAYIAKVKLAQPEFGSYYWTVYKAGQNVEEGEVFWPADRTKPKPPTPPAGGSPWLGLIVIAIIIVVALYFLPKIGPSKEIIAPIEKVV